SPESKTSNRENPLPDRSPSLAKVIPELVSNNAFFVGMMMKDWDVITLTSEEIKYEYHSISQNPHPHIAILNRLGAVGITMGKFIAHLKSLPQVDLELVKALEQKYIQDSSFSNGSLPSSPESKTSNRENPLPDRSPPLAKVIPELLRNKPFMDDIMKKDWEIIAQTSEEIKYKYHSISQNPHPHIAILVELSMKGVTMGKFIAHLKSLLQVDLKVLKVLEEQYSKIS
ncbi:MAG: hypothetical protein SAK29_00680, partial [Scytonema sp. PMC 1069.18]|nr:hypothetical protein [Scytonema sp. PMC 1069.18]